MPLGPSPRPDPVALIRPVIDGERPPDALAMRQRLEGLFEKSKGAVICTPKAIDGLHVIPYSGYITPAPLQQLHQPYLQDIVKQPDFRRSLGVSFCQPSCRLVIPDLTCNSTKQRYALKVMENSNCCTTASMLCCCDMHWASCADQAHSSVAF